MNHIDDRLVNEYLDGELDAAVYERVEGHLAGCDHCRGRVAGMGRLFAALDEVPEVALGVDLSQRVVARLAAEFKPRPVPRWTFPVVALQLLMALALFVWLWPSVQPGLAAVGRVVPETADLLPAFSLSDLFEALTDGLERLGDFGQAIGPASPLPLVEGVLILGLVFVFWLAGSGLLLRQSLSVQQKS